jgi:uncharacterized protein YqkB
MEVFTLKRKKGDGCQIKNNESSRLVNLALENPQDTSVDLGAPIYNMGHIQVSFQHAYEAIRYNSSENISILKTVFGDISVIKSLKM